MNKIFSGTDKIVCNKYLCVPIFLLNIWCIFRITFGIGNAFTGILNIVILRLQHIITATVHNKIAASMLNYGIISGCGIVVSFIPTVFLVFTAIFYLEKSGYITRISQITEPALQKLGLNSQSVLPIFTGFGCSIPAYMATNMIKNETQRFLTKIVISFIPCSAKLTTFVFLANVLFAKPYNAIFVIYICGIFFGLLFAALTKKAFLSKNYKALCVGQRILTKYTLPSFMASMKFSLQKVKSFLTSIASVVLLSSVVVWFLSSFSLNMNFVDRDLSSSIIASLTRYIEPIFAPLGFDYKIVTALITALVSKEMFVSSLSVLYSVSTSGIDISLIDNIRGQITLPIGLSVMTFIFFYLPCLSATATFYNYSSKASRAKQVSYLILITTSIAYIGSFVIYRASLLLM